MAEEVNVVRKYTTSDKLGIALACLAGVMAIILSLVERTPWTVAGLLVAMAAFACLSGSALCAPSYGHGSGCQRPIPADRQHQAEKSETEIPPELIGGGGWTRTNDLRIMSSTAGSEPL
jgi:hypothetical protein